MATVAFKLSGPALISRVIFGGCWRVWRESDVPVDWLGMQKWRKPGRECQEEECESSAKSTFLRQARPRHDSGLPCFGCFGSFGSGPIQFSGLIGSKV